MDRHYGNQLKLSYFSFNSFTQCKQSYIPLETKHPAEHWGPVPQCLWQRGCTLLLPQCLQLLRSSMLTAPRSPPCCPLLTSAKRQILRQVFNLSLHVSYYGHHACKHSFLFPIYVPMPLRSSRYQIPGRCTHRWGTWNGWCTSTAQCFSEQPTKAASWQLQGYARTQRTHINCV